MARKSVSITAWVLEESSRAHLRDGVGEQALADEDVGVLCKKAEDQPRHEVIHVVAARGRAPFGVVFQKFDVKPVEAAGRPDVERVFADLPDGGDAGERQEETEMVGKVLIMRKRQVSSLARFSASKFARLSPE